MHTLSLKMLMRAIVHYGRGLIKLIELSKLGKNLHSMDIGLNITLILNDIKYLLVTCHAKASLTVFIQKSLSLFLCLWAQ